ncbi:unnamed protein product [Urochloa decumbens]|uniref:cysteine dioxygenase n=1 Tax=Urochloa decumbens TaxID=240449 RepID=A0ABC8Y192_9POAL
MMVAEGRSRRGGGAEAAKGRRDYASRRRLSGGVSVRRRVHVVDATVTTAPAAAAAAATMTPLQRLLAACRRAFRGPGTVPAHDDVALIRGILDKMGPDDVHLSAVTKAAAASGLQRRPRRPIITRTTIYECTNFSVREWPRAEPDNTYDLGFLSFLYISYYCDVCITAYMQIVIFLLPPGAVIPLHDHPGMTVFSKLLRGSLHVTSYDWVAADDDPTSPRRDLAPPRLARLVLDDDLRAPCGALVLFPESGGNMHRFAASTACAVLDVLGPPYSGDRDCTYYQDLPYSHYKADDDEAAGDGDGDVHAAEDERHQGPRRRLGWLLETGKPEELEMYEVPYKGPPIL